LRERIWNHLWIIIYQREEKVKMLEGKGVVEETDMPLKMQNEAMAYACEALDLYDVCHCRSIACHIKKVHYLTLFPPFILLFS
jgi:dynein light chain LC8-type